MNGYDCSIAGNCPDWAAYQKAILIAGNIEGFGQIDAQNLKIQAIVAKEPSVEFYLIQKGDTLSKIAKQFYGDANAYQQFFEANR